MCSDQPTTPGPSPQDRDDDWTAVDELTRGMHQGRAEVEAPQSVAQAEDFMADNDQVHGVGIGLGADGDPCVVLFTDNLPADQVPDTLDGLPVRVEDSGEFTAGG